MRKKMNEFVLKRWDGTLPFEQIQELLWKIRDLAVETGISFHLDYADTEESFRERLGEGGITVLALAPDSGKLVGTASLGVKTDEELSQQPVGYITGMAVYPEYRGSGLGSRLLTEALRFAEEQKLFPVMLTTSWTNKPAIAFYRANGFRITKVFGTDRPIVKMALWEGEAPFTETELGEQVTDRLVRKEIELKEKNRQLKEKNAELREKNSALKESLSGLQNANTELRNSDKRLQEKLKALSSQLSELEKENGELRAKYDEIVHSKAWKAWSALSRK